MSTEKIFSFCNMKQGRTKSKMNNTQCEREIECNPRTPASHNTLWLTWSTSLTCLERQINTCPVPCLEVKGLTKIDHNVIFSSNAVDTF